MTDFNRNTSIALLNNSNIMIIPSKGYDGRFVATVVSASKPIQEKLFYGGAMKYLDITEEPWIEAEDLEKVINATTPTYYTVGDQEPKKIFMLNQAALKLIIEAGVTNIVNYEELCTELGIEVQAKGNFRDRSQR